MEHSVEVVRCRLPADEHHRLAGLAARLGRVRVEHDRARRSARRRVQPFRNHLDRRVRVDHRMEQLVELAGIDPRHRLLGRDHALVDHVHGHLQRSSGGALRGPRLQEVEPTVLDGELDVLRVAVVLLETTKRVEELLVCGRHLATHLIDRLRRTDPCDDIFALGVREELAIEPRLARRRIAREAHPGARTCALVAEDHLDDVHRRADVVGDVVRAPVDLCARRVPRVEDGPRRAAQLLGRILREGGAGLLLVDAAEARDQLAQLVGAEVDVLASAGARLEIDERLLEPMAGDAVDDLAVHLDQPAVRVVGEPRVARRCGEPLDCRVAEPEVEDRVHHPGHRDRSARPHRHEQRIERVSEALARPFLECRNVRRDLGVEPRGHLAATAQVGAARVGRNREAGRNRHAERGHLGEADAFPPEELPAAP